MGRTQRKKIQEMKKLQELQSFNDRGIHNTGIGTARHCLLVSRPDLPKHRAWARMSQLIPAQGYGPVIRMLAWRRATHRRVQAGRG